MKPQSRKVVLNVSHLENALIAYLKPYFPEAVEIGGVDISLPVSQQDGNFELTIYLSTPTPQEIAAEVSPEAIVKASQKRATKADKRKKEIKADKAAESRIHNV